MGLRAFINHSLIRLGGRVVDILLLARAAVVAHSYGPCVWWPTLRSIINRKRQQPRGNMLGRRPYPWMVVYIPFYCRPGGVGVLLLVSLSLHHFPSSLCRAARRRIHLNNRSIRIHVWSSWTEWWAAAAAAMEWNKKGFHVILWLAL